MPRPKISFKENQLQLEVDNIEFTAGQEIIKVGHLKVKLDVNDLLQTKLPNLTTGHPLSINLFSFGEKKIQCIKEVRGFTGMGLKEAKEVVEKAPHASFSAATKSEHECKAFIETIERYTGRAELVRDNVIIPNVLDKLREMLSEALSQRDENVTEKL